MLEKLFQKRLTYSARLKKKSNGIHFREQLNHVKNILIHFPEEIESTRVDFIHRQLSHIFPSCRIDYMVFENLSPEKKTVFSPLPSKNEIHVIQRADINFFKKLKKPVLQKLQNKQFDMALDFSLHWNVTLADTYASLGAGIVAGYFQNHHQDAFYNLLIRTQNKDSYDRCLFLSLSKLKN